MNRYQSGKIYTIRSHQTDKFYIGSTVQPLSKRLCGHKDDFTAFKLQKTRYITSFDILKYADFYIELLELFPCNTKIELNKREGELIRLHKDDCVNKCIPNRTQAEWYVDNQERVKQQHKQYTKDNKEKLENYRKEYMKDNANREKVKLRRQQRNIDNKEEIAVKRKQAYESNKEAVSQQGKVYRENNKERRKQHCSQPITCECGSSIRLDSKNKHLKSKKHQEFITNI